MLVSICLVFLSTIFPTMTIGGQREACAACKYQRRKCSKDCPLAPFFPADEPEKFRCAHRLYGVRNIMNILKKVKPKYRHDAMTSIIFESTMRAQFPVSGCVGIINQLHSELEKTTQNLLHVNSQIAMCKEQKIPTQELAIVTDDVNVNLNLNPEVPMIANHNSTGGISEIYINAEQVDKTQNPSFDIQQEGDASRYDDILPDHNSSGEASLKNINVIKEMEDLITEEANSFVLNENIRKIETAVA